MRFAYSFIAANIQFVKRITTELLFLDIIDVFAISKHSIQANLFLSIFIISHVAVCINQVKDYTIGNVHVHVPIPGGPQKTEQSIQSIFQDFALINSYRLQLPCWIEHLFLIIITPKS